MQMPGSFNAQQYEPNQGFGVHPPALKIPFSVTNTIIKENSNKDGGYFLVEFTTPLGVIGNIYNIWSKTPRAVEIAHGQLSALCRAVGRFQIDWANEGAALRGATGLMDIGYQKGEEPDPAFPDRKGYTEVKKVYDMAGNDPAAKGSQQSVQQQASPQAQPTQQQPGNWQQPTQTQQPQQQAPQGQAWQPGGAAPGNAAPPWGNRQ